MRPNGDRAKAADYHNDIFTKLERIQATTNLIDLECKAWDELWAKVLHHRMHKQEDTQSHC